MDGWLATARCLPSIVHALGRCNEIAMSAAELELTALI
jgi:hypothetical protein